LAKEKDEKNKEKKTLKKKNFTHIEKHKR